MTRNSDRARGAPVATRTARTLRPPASAVFMFTKGEKIGASAGPGSCCYRYLRQRRRGWQRHGQGGFGQQSTGAASVERGMGTQSLSCDKAGPAGPCALHVVHAPIRGGVRWLIHTRAAAPGQVCTHRHASNKLRPHNI